MSESQIKKESGEFQNSGGSVPEIMLAIETGITGGSVSLFKQGVEMACSIGRKDVSRAEDVLDEISKILKRNDVAPQSIGLTAFSKGPGSSTGLRIGAALALGLKKSIGCKISSFSILPALAAAEDSPERLIAAVPFGSRQVCWQYFERNMENSGQPQEIQPKIRVSQTDLVESVWKNFNFDKLLLHEKLYRDLYIQDNGQFADGQFQRVSVVSVGENMARFIGLKVSDAAAGEHLNDLNLIYANNF